MPTYIEIVKEALERRRQEVGPDAPSVKDLEQQLRALEYQEETGHLTTADMFLATNRPGRE